MRLLLLLALLASVVPSAASAAGPSRDPTTHRLGAGLHGGSGSTIGPDRALYVTESAAYASGLPELIPAVGFGGPVDIAFLGGTAYVLVTLVGPDVGGSDVVGIYRVDGQTASPWSPTSARSPSPTRLRRTSLFRAASSTRCKPIVAGCW